MICTPTIQAAAIGIFALLASGCATTEELATEAKVAATTSSNSQTSDDPEQVVCRKYDSTGSRVRREKVCMTNREWARMSEDAESYTTSLQNGGSSQPGGEGLQGSAGSGGR